jgi:hypothetical protein
MKRIAVVLVALGALGSVGGAGARVLRVGTYKGIRGQYQSIQAAVNAAYLATGSWSGRATTRRPPLGRPPAVPTRLPAY